jgi:hypothetical protein
VVGVGDGSSRRCRQRWIAAVPPVQRMGIEQ